MIHLWTGVRFSPVPLRREVGMTDLDNLKVMLSKVETRYTENQEAGAGEISVSFQTEFMEYDMMFIFDRHGELVEIV